MIDFTKIFQLKSLKPKNKGPTNFYECCDLTKKVYLVDISPTISQNENLPAIARNARTYPTFFRIVNVFPSENETSCGTSDRPILTEKKNLWVKNYLRYTFSVKSHELLWMLWFDGKSIPKLPIYFFYRILTFKKVDWRIS